MPEQHHSVPSIACQISSSVERKAVIHAALLEDILVQTIGIESLDRHSDKLRSGSLIPVGSVEYVRAALQAAGLSEPPNMSYPVALDDFLHRRVRLGRAGEVLGTWFVKPQQTKAFTGFVFDTMTDPEKLNPHDKEQHARFIALDARSLVWISEPVKWLSEVRYYLDHGQVVGSARYDADGADAAPLPDPDVVGAAVSEMTSTLRPDLICALDMGVLDSGETALIEVNDFWAIGLYGRAMPSKVYLDMLVRRWQQICADATPQDRLVERCSL